MRPSTQQHATLTYMVVGHDGWLGRKVCALLRAAGQVVVAGPRRVASAEDVRAALRQCLPDRIVCAAGRTHTATCATIDGLEGGDAWPDLVLANQLLPLWLAHAAAQLRIPMLYLGTGCIFRYDEEHPIGGRAFTEDDTPNFFGSAYSRVKGATDVLLRQYSDVVINARIRMPIDDEDGPRDFISKLLTYPRISSVPNSMTVLHDVLPALLAVLHARIRGAFGALNAVNPLPLDHEQVLRIYAEETGVAHAYSLVPQEELEQQLAAGRSNNTLSAAKLQAALAALPPDVRAQFGCTAELAPLATAVRVAAQRRARAAAAVRAAAPAGEEPMRLLITGGCGFIASNLVNACLRDARVQAVINVDCLDECASLDNVLPPAVGAPHAVSYRLYPWDLAADGAEVRLKDVMLRHGITHVLHLAAKTHVDASFDGSTSFEYTKSNVLGTHRLLEAARRYVAAGGRLRRFLHVSTDEVYGEVHVGAAHEASLLNPTNPYAATKAAAEFMLRSYGTSFKLPWVMVRCNNVYGPNQAEKVIPTFARLLAEGKPLTIHGDGTARRMFVHVTDVVRALMLVLVRGEAGAVYNIGADAEVSVLELATRMSELVGVPLHVRFVDDRPFNDSRYAVDDFKLRRLGWAPTIPFEKGLYDTVHSLLQRFRTEGAQASAAAQQQLA